MTLRFKHTKNLCNFPFRDELHAIASSKKFSSKNKALSEVRLFRKDPLRDDEAGPEFEKVRKKTARNHKT